LLRERRIAPCQGRNANASEENIPQDHQGLLKCANGNS